MADQAPKVAAKLNQEQLQPRADYLADHFEEKARAFAKRLGPLASGLPDSIEKAVKKDKVVACSPWCFEAASLLTHSFDKK